MSYILWVFVSWGTVGVSQTTAIFKTEQACKTAKDMICKRLNSWGSTCYSECLPEGAK